MPKVWRGNVRYLLKQLFRWSLNCTEIAQASDRRAVFPHHYPKRKPTANLLKEPLLALPKIVLFYALPQVLSPFTRSSKRPLLYVAFIHEISCQKSRGRRFVPSDTSDELLGSFRYPFASIAQPEGFSSKQQGFHLKRPTCIFSSPSTWRHSISPNFFYKPNTARKPKTSTYKLFSLNDKNSFLLFTKAIMLPGQAILPQRWTGFPSQPTPISKGIESLRATANTAYPFSSRYKRKRWTAFSRCAKRRIIPA